MTPEHNNQSDPHPLTSAAFHILLVLVGGEMHGYGIMQEVKVISDNAFTIGPGTLYRTIQQLIDRGLIVEASEKVDAQLNDERRRYYRLTESGHRSVQAEAERLAALVRIARQKRLLDGGTA